MIKKQSSKFVLRAPMGVQTPKTKVWNAFKLQKIWALIAPTGNKWWRAAAHLFHHWSFYLGTLNFVDLYITEDFGNRFWHASTHKGSADVAGSVIYRMWAPNNNTRGEQIDLYYSLNICWVSVLAVIVGFPLFGPPGKADIIFCIFYGPHSLT